MLDIENILSTFDPISLKEMDGVKLMDRTDTKFTFSIKQLAEILEEIKSNYRILVVQEKRMSRYETLYYDTESLNLYGRHHNGELNRYKIRHRTYVESNIGFLEVKFKNNKGRTLKERIKKSETPKSDWDKDCQDFLVTKLPFSPYSLVPVIWVNYSRITLVNRYSAERLTIDLHLEFKTEQTAKLMEGLVIAEVKQEKRKPSPFLDVMKKKHIREGSISKYCMGIALCYNTVKKNNFKQKLLSLKYIVKHDLIASSFRNNL